MLSVEVGGKACKAPPVAEEANRVWHSGRLFARIQAEKGGNRKRKRDTAHDGVGSSGAVEPFKHLSLIHISLSLVATQEHSNETAVDKTEEGGDDVKSSCPL